MLRREGLDPVVCVLGCRPGSAAFARRAVGARDAFLARGAGLVVACGGKSWDGRVEADELARMLEDGGVPSASILRERHSLDTRENAIEASLLLVPRGVRRVVLVTCAWHLARASMLFERFGLTVEGAGVDPPSPTLLSRAYWSARERVSTLRDKRRTEAAWS